MAFKGFYEHAEHYYKNSIPAAPVISPQLSVVPLTDG